MDKTFEQFRQEISAASSAEERMALLDKTYSDLNGTRPPHWSEVVSGYQAVLRKLLGNEEAEIIAKLAKAITAKTVKAGVIGKPFPSDTKGAATKVEVSLG